MELARPCYEWLRQNFADNPSEQAAEYKAAPDIGKGHAYLVLVLAIASASAFASPVAALAQARTDVKVGMMLEPSGLDPTAEAAAAVDEVL